MILLLFVHYHAIYLIGLLTIAVACFTDNEVDGDTLGGLTEQMLSELIPVMRYRVKLMKLLRGLNINTTHKPSSSASLHSPVDDEVDDVEGDAPDASADSRLFKLSATVD